MIYYAVPAHYTIGEEFDAPADAFDHARRSIRPLDYTGIGRGVRHTRAFVDERQRDKTGDRPLRRWEVFMDGRVEERR